MPIEYDPNSSNYMAKGSYHAGSLQKGIQSAAKKFDEEDMRADRWWGDQKLSAGLLKENTTAGSNSKQHSISFDGGHRLAP